MKLFYSPNSCALGIHVILEEIGKPYDRELIDLHSGAQYKPPYAALNPKGKVPALLRDDGTLMTEWPAIAWYLARTNPALNLLPEEPVGEARVLELLDYMVATVHMRGVTRIFRPRNFTPTNADEPAVKQTGRDILASGMRLLAHDLGAKAYLLGDYSIADAYLFLLENWCAGPVQMALPENLAAHLQRMRARPAVQRAMAAEGLA